MAQTLVRKGFIKRYGHEKRLSLRHLRQLSNELIPDSESLTAKTLP